LFSQNGGTPKDDFIDFITNLPQPMTPGDMMRGAEGLKPIPEGNEGLPKLPEDVRNKMGYMQDGRQVEPDLTNKVIAIILGQARDNGEIDKFIEQFGSEVFQDLRRRVLASLEMNPQTQGLIQGQPNGGMSDEVFGTIAPNRPVAVSPGEYIVPADVVSQLGDGDTDSGARRLDQLLDNSRMIKTGTKEQASPIKLDDVMKGVK
jgi:hypothetical protein